VPVEVRAEEDLTEAETVRLLVACVAVAALLAACGGKGSSWSNSACRRQAVSVADHARSMLLHYRGRTVYPADMSYLGLKSSLRRYNAAGCRQRTLGETLARVLPAKERRRLVALLPARTGSRIRRAVAAARE
jgi:hypothetical protein